MPARKRAAARTTARKTHGSKDQQLGRRTGPERPRPERPPQEARGAQDRSSQDGSQGSARKSSSRARRRKTARRWSAHTPQRGASRKPGPAVGECVKRYAVFVNLHVTLT